MENDFMVVKATQNRSRSAHLVFAYSRLRLYPAAHSRACIGCVRFSASENSYHFLGLTEKEPRIARIHRC